MKLFAIYITNKSTAYGGAQPLRQAVLFVFLGNPTTYKGNSLVWEQGRKLASGRLKGNNFSYVYDGNGMRYQKIVNGTETEYYYNGDQLLMENRGGSIDRIYYIYDASGVAGILIGGSYYYFDKNTLGDVVAIRNEVGVILAQYEYDAWGNHTVTDRYGNVNTNSTFIGNINPIRYRGYYYDTETGFYYLQTRYYDPSICRFINADNYELVALLSCVPGQLNMYTYCGNNPIMYTDATGCFWDYVIDAGFFIWGLIDFINEPTWENFGWLALDAVCLIVPFIPGIGKATKAVTKIDDIYDISRFAGSADNIVLLGQSMKTRVIPEAMNLGVNYYRGFSKYDNIARFSGKLANGVGYLHNMCYIAGKSLIGTRFIDMGFDVARIGEKGIWFSKFTIYSERFVAQTFRWKNIIRLGYSLS